MQKMRQGDKFQTFFCFSKKLYMKWSAGLTSIYSDSHELATRQKQIV